MLDSYTTMLIQRSQTAAAVASFGSISCDGHVTPAIFKVEHESHPGTYLGEGASKSELANW